MHVFVATPRQVAQHQCILRQIAGDFDGLGNGVAGFQGGEDALGARQCMERRQRFIVGHADILRTPGITEEGMLWPDARVIQARGDVPEA